MKSLPYSQNKLKEIYEEGRQLGLNELKEINREQVKYLIEHSILSELEHFIGCRKYKRDKERTDYRNGYYERLIATTLGEIPIRFPRLRKGSFKSAFIKNYSRRTQDVDYAVLSCFILGGSVRKTKAICDLFINVQISHTTVSRITKALEERARDFHMRKLKTRYKFLLLDGLWIKVQGKYKKEVVLFAMGITADGEKEIIDFMIADGESEENYSKLLNHLIKKGLDLETIELVIHDGAKGLQAALDICLPYTQRQYCIFHKIQGIAPKLNHIKLRSAIMKDAGNVYRNANSREQAIQNIKLFTYKWQRLEPRAVKYFTAGFDKTLTFYDFPKSLWKSISTNNYLERRLKEVRRRTRPMGNFKNDKSANRIIYALVYVSNEGYAPNEFTHNS